MPLPGVHSALPARHTALAQVAKAQTELDERKAKVVTLEAKVVRQSKTLRAAAAKFHEVRAQVITARPLSALSRTHPPTNAQVCLAAHTRLAHHLHSPHSTSTQVPTEIQHASYLTGQVALDLTKLSKQMQHSESAGKLLLKEMPEISKLAGELKEAKPGSLKATKIHNKLVGTVEATGSLLFRGKLQHATLAHHAVKRKCASGI